MEDRKYNINGLHNVDICIFWGSLSQCQKQKLVVCIKFLGLSLLNNIYTSINSKDTTKEVKTKLDLRHRRSLGYTTAILDSWKVPLIQYLHLGSTYPNHRIIFSGVSRVSLRKREDGPLPRNSSVEDPRVFAQESSVT